MPEIKTCEEYVLNELAKAEDTIDLLEKGSEELITYIGSLIQSLKENDISVPCPRLFVSYDDFIRAIEAFL